MIAPALLAAMDSVSALKRRARILLLVGDSIGAEGDRDIGNAIAKIAEDLGRNLETLAAQLDSLETSR